MKVTSLLITDGDSELLVALRPPTPGALSGSITALAGSAPGR